MTKKVDIDFKSYNSKTSCVWLFIIAHLFLYPFQHGAWTFIILVLGRDLLINTSNSQEFLLDQTQRVSPIF